MNVFKQEIVETRNVDVLVIGGGTAGSVAAASAARKGAETLLVEHYGFLGGISTAAGVGWWFARIDGMGDIFKEIRLKLNKFNASSKNLFEPEYLKFVLQEVVLNYGVNLLLHTDSIGVEKKDKRITKVYVRNKSGIMAITPSVVIDTTGDGDVAYQAGADILTDLKNGNKLAMSLTCTLYDTGEYVEPFLPEGLPEYKSKEDLPGFYSVIPFPGGKLYANLTKVFGLDPINGWDLTTAEIEARKQVMSALYFLQKTKFPTYRLNSIPTQIGVREGRRVEGDYIINENDLYNTTQHNDVIAVATAQIDFHDNNKPGGGGVRKVINPYPIPYRSLLVKNIENLLTAGRCISSDQVAQSSLRMTPTCAAMGQASGVAAYMALKKNGIVREVNINILQSNLLSMGVELDHNKFESFPGGPKDIVDGMPLSDFDFGKKKA